MKEKGKRKKQSVKVMGFPLFSKLLLDLLPSFSQGKWFTLLKDTLLLTKLSSSLLRSGME